MENWILYDQNKVGTYMQCSAVASFFSQHTFKEIPVKLPFWRFLPFSFKKPTTYPKIIIAGGRHALQMASWFSKKSKIIALQNPKHLIDKFDLVIVPKHDKVKKQNHIIETIGCLSIKKQNDYYIPWKDLPRPWCGVLLGGNSKHHTYTKEDAILLAHYLNTFPHSLLLIPSRRTPIKWLDFLSKQLIRKSIWIWNQKEKNPYASILNNADCLVITSDSVSMLSEGCMTGKSVYIFNLPLKSQRITNLTFYLINQKYATCLKEYREFYPEKVLDEYSRIYKQIVIKTKKW